MCCVASRQPSLTQRLKTNDFDGIPLKKKRVNITQRCNIENRILTEIYNHNVYKYVIFYYFIIT